VAGENFGMGSSRPIGEVMRSAGIVAVIAESINGLAMRTCVNSSLPAINCLGASDLFNDGDIARVDFLSGLIENLTSGKSVQTHPMAPLLAEIVAAGGVVPMLVKDGYIHAEPFNASSS
jgi:3-isopropylmalate/(R)-2-methylmalate dehydratase small subunit